MIVALPVDGDFGIESEISQHFGRTRYFAFARIEKGSIIEINIKENPFMEHGVGDLPNFIKENNAEVVIAYGMGEKAIELFNSYGIDVITGANGKIKDVLEEFLKNSLDLDTSWKDNEDFGHEHHDRD
ncbi:MAG: NifB/NifX family molybdenum-iron cluster-binding protein [Thermoplasmata archaeon]